MVLGIAVAVSSFNPSTTGGIVADAMLHEDDSEWINEDGSNLISEEG